MKVKELGIDQLFIFIDSKGEARLFLTVSKNDNYPEEVPAKQVVSMSTKNETLKLSLGTTGFKPDDKVYRFKNSEY